jgi:hypothetical protein
MFPYLELLRHCRFGGFGLYSFDHAQIRGAGGLLATERITAYLAMIRDDPSEDISAATQFQGTISCYNTRWFGQHALWCEMQPSCTYSQCAIDTEK